MREQLVRKVEIIPVGTGAEVTPLLKEWNKNRYSKLETNLDKQYGYVFENIILNIFDLEQFE